MERGRGVEEDHVLSLASLGEVERAIASCRVEERVDEEWERELQKQA